VRAIVVLALVLVACGRSDRPDTPAQHDAPSASSSTGPDQIILRIPRSGGAVRAFRYSQLDSVIWTSSMDAAAPRGVLSFDGDAGSLAYVDRNGIPGRIDLRSGTVTAATRAKLTSLASSDGRAIYGIAANGKVTRLTPSGDWTYEPPRRARLVMPQQDGTLLVLTDHGSELGVLRVQPPDTNVIDSAAVPDAPRILHAQAGDRVYFGIDSSLVGLRGRTLQVTPALHLDGRVRAVAPTPSGDRLFVTTDSSRTIVVVDRYRDEIARTIELPGTVSALRMDPLGRYVLARAATGDSAWVVAVGTARVIGSVTTEWREDLPFVAPDGAIALTEKDDVRLVDGETLRERSVVSGGARDFWHLIVWNGFRPRAGDAVASSPTVADSDSVAAPADSSDTTTAVPPPAPKAPPDTSNGQTVRTPTTAQPPRAPIPRPAPPRLPADTPTTGAQPPRARGWVVSFAAFVSEPPARARAKAISVEGQQARVVAGQTNGTTVYRVVLGPYPTKADAERIGRASRESFWVYEGNP
jgi:cell division septation protein DedD